MYTREQLERYPYFAKVIEEFGIENVLDSLTGLVSRPYIIGFAQSLVENQTPFTYAMLDLDNFKYINDTYGHHAGDGVLKEVSENLISYLGDAGIAGRFGGDEFIIVNLRDISYQEKKCFFEILYTRGKVLRKNVVMQDCDPFVTGTVGCATFPNDAGDYEELFSMIDKTLYRGKSKGRNCYIIYVESKHKDIQIQPVTKQGGFTAFQSLVRLFELVPGLDNKLRSVMPFLMDELQISDLYVVSKSGEVRAVRNPEYHETVTDLVYLTGDDRYCTNDIEKIRGKCPEFYDMLKKHEMETVLVTRIAMDLETDGYLICSEPRSHRIWQDSECELLYFLAKMIAARARIDGESM